MRNFKILFTKNAYQNKNNAEGYSIKNNEINDICLITGACIRLLDDVLDLGVHCTFPDVTIS